MPVESKKLIKEKSVISPTSDSAAGNTGKELGAVQDAESGGLRLFESQSRFYQLPLA